MTPPEELFIYYLKGRLALSDQKFQNNFIGNWEEERFILSGLMRGEAKHIANTLQRYPVKILKQWTQDGIWHTIYGKAVREEYISLQNS
jgi:hypothetical protein